MRRVLNSDVTAAARVLLSIPDGARAQACARLLEQAHCADRYTRRLGRPHPRWGNGTLLAVARMRAEGAGWSAETGFDDEDYCQCIAQVVQQISAQRGRYL